MPKGEWMNAKLKTLLRYLPLALWLLMLVANRSMFIKAANIGQHSRRPTTPRKCSLKCAWRFC